jgi:hypothetical protein
VRLEQRAHLLELREHEAAIAFVERLLEHLGQEVELAGAAGSGAAVHQVVRRMVADLLETQQRRQDRAAPRMFEPPALLDLGQPLAHDGLVEDRLLARQARHRRPARSCSGRSVMISGSVLSRPQDERPHEPRERRAVLAVPLLDDRVLERLQERACACRAGPRSGSP